MKELLTYSFSNTPFKKIVFILFCTCIYVRLFSQPTVTVNTMASSPVTPFIKDYVSSQGVISTITYNPQIPSGYQFNVKIGGKITRLSPSPFTIELKSQYRYTKSLIMPGIYSVDKLTAFGGFFVDSLDIADIDRASITDPGGSQVSKLPDGNYEICFSAWDNKDSLLSRGCGYFTISCGVLINTMATVPIDPIISKSITEGRINSTIQIGKPQQCNTTVQVKLFGKIERVSPSSFSISLNPNYQLQSPITINLGITQLTRNQLTAAFANFNESYLVPNGIDLASIKDANNNIKLPSGNYRICFNARYVKSDGSLGDPASDPNLGCGSFTICNQVGNAPQFTQPVNNFNINSEIAIIQPVSPVVFSWTPPQSTCGLPPSGYTYDLDIWELYPNQTVTDAVNNPYVFRKTSLPSTTFLLDLNLNKDVLKQGKRYAMRVRAVSINPSSPVEIENNGYSRIEVFQYGGSLITQNGVPDPHDYYIPFEERRSGYWIDVYQRSRQKDTLVPIKEYIAFALTQKEIAYSLDAIELFLALNPELVELKHVKISYAPILPVFPPVSSNDQKSFDKEHAANLVPDKMEENKFLKYLDTLNTYKKIPDKAVKLVNDLVNHLNSVKVEISSVDRVTVNFINGVLSELLYELRLYSRNLNTAQYNQLEQLVTTIRELTAEASKSTSFFYLPAEKFQTGPNEYNSKISPLQNGNEIETAGYMPVTIEEQLLPFDVIVWRTGTVAPYKPVLDAPDLKASFRVFYILSKMYNHKNPEVNATSSSRLASTIRVSLPSNTMFSFWTLNMVNHRTTGAKDVDLRDIKNSMKEFNLKRPSIVIKVD